MIVLRSATAVSQRSGRRSARTSVTRPPTGSGAVKELLDQIDLLLVIGSKNSSEHRTGSSRPLCAGGVPSYLIDDETEIDEAWIGDEVGVVGITSGASAPEKLVQRTCAWFRERGVTDIEEHKFLSEDIEFRLPVELRRELALADTQN